MAVVALSFGSALIPVILGGYRRRGLINMSIPYLLGDIWSCRVSIISIILLGATIDYAILYSNYLGARKSLDKTGAVAEARVTLRCTHLLWWHFYARRPDLGLTSASGLSVCWGIIMRAMNLRGYYDGFVLPALLVILDKLYVF